MKTATEIKSFDHAEWISKLKSYKNELTSLEGSLSAVAETSKKTEVLARVEHFQNQFILQRSNVNDVLHAVKMDEKESQFEAVTGKHEDGRSISEQRSKDLAESFEKNMNELKSDFNKFLLKNKQ